jgi:hypothetical protein
MRRPLPRGRRCRPVDETRPGYRADINGAIRTPQATARFFDIQTVTIACGLDPSSEAAARKFRVAAVNPHHP